MSSYDKYLAGLDLERLPVGMKEVLIAVGQSQDSEPIDQSCPICVQPISVEPLVPKGQSSPTAWRTHCPCGKCNDTLRGL
jgi:hypothetical protein